MRVLGDPLLHLDGEPECVNAKGDDGEKHPLDVVAEQLHTFESGGEGGQLVEIAMRSPRSSARQNAGRSRRLAFGVW